MSKTDPRNRSTIEDDGVFICRRYFKYGFCNRDKFYELLEIVGGLSSATPQGYRAARKTVNQMRKELGE